MTEQKSLIRYLAEAYDRYRAEQRSASRQQASSGPGGRLRWLLHLMVPNVGTLLIVAGLLWAQSAGALPQSLIPNLQSPSSTGTIAYQGRLADSDGNPITETVNMEFRLYDVAKGGTPLWSELWTGSNAVRVSDGLFNVMLGSLEPIPQGVVAGHDQLWLGITVGTDDEMSPRVQLGSVPFAVQALTVPDGSVTTEKLADEAVTAAKLNPNDNYEIEGHVRAQHFYANYIRDSQGWSIEGGNPDVATLRFDADRARLWNPVGKEILTLLGEGSVGVHGTLNMHGNTIINQGAMVEAGLQTSDELAAESIDRFSEGDVLCWAGKQLKKCDEANTRRVVAVADENGKPIVIGAEKIKVLGPVQAGDLLVASDVPGYAVVNNQPAPGMVIAKALEDFAGKQDTIKAMIRNF